MVLKMKKYGKKWRKLQKENEMRKANVKIGEPYSKSRLKKRLCLHYGGIPGGILPGASDNNPGGILPPGRSS